MNEKNIFESQDKKINSLTESELVYKDSIAKLQERIAELNYFTLQGNENAMTYLETSGYEAAAVEAQITDAIYEYNTVKNGNPLVPFDGMEGTMRINKIKFLNHKWLLADFTDGTYWGEVLLSYNFNEENKLEFDTLGSLLYPR